MGWHFAYVFWIWLAWQVLTGSALGGAVDFQYGLLLEHWFSQVLEFFQVVLPGVEQLCFLVLIHFMEEKYVRAERVLQESVFQAVGFVSGCFYDFFCDFEKCADAVWFYRNA